MSKPTRPLRSPQAPSRPRTFFVTSSTWGRRSLFQSEHLARLFLEVLSSYRDRHRYLLHELVATDSAFLSVGLLKWQKTTLNQDAD